MIKSLFSCSLLALAIMLWVGCSSGSGHQDNGVLDRFKTSLVELEISRKSYNYRMPWVTNRKQTNKNGVVLSGKRILTTADDVSGSVLVRVQKDGESKKYNAKFIWVDYYANLAVLEVEDDEFWSGLEPATLADTVPQSGNLHILRWTSGRLESREAEIERLLVGKSQTSYVEYLQLQVTSEIDAAGWAEVVVQGDRVAGLTASANGKSLKILPSAVIGQMLEAREAQDHAGLGYFDFAWQPGTNPALLDSLGMQDTGHGILVTRVGLKRVADEVLQAGDVILKIDGFDIDPEGKYKDPDYGRLHFSQLATRQAVAGQVLPMTIWRDGKEMKVDYLLPAADFESDLVPDAEFDEAPEYLIAGGMLFQPLTGPLLAAYGKNSPFLMRYYDYQRPVEDRDSIVVLTGVMPDPYNRGYEDSRNMIVDTVNGQPVATLQDIVDAFEQVEGDYHVLQFFPDQPLRTVVLDATTMSFATARVLERYRVPEDRNIRRSSSASEAAEAEVAVQ
ncbi:MAG: hypothetical protein AAF571_12780 [Verrucomicrobiota bacterium]